MQTPDQAQMAVHEQDVLKRTGADIYVNFSTKVPFVRLPSEMGVPEDGLSKDFTMIANGPSKILLLHYSQCGMTEFSVTQILREINFGNFRRSTVRKSTTKSDHAQNLSVKSTL